MVLGKRPYPNYSTSIKKNKWFMKKSAGKQEKTQLDAAILPAPFACSP
jgi:hypothetical protein